MTTRKTKSGKIVNVREPRDLIKSAYSHLTRLELFIERENLLNKDYIKNVIIDPETKLLHIEVIEELINANILQKQAA